MTLADALVTFIRQHPRLLVLTGAGISTDSGIPDYRDRNGQWKRKQPIQHGDFMANLHARQRYWGRSLVGWPVMQRARPNAAHRALALLEQHGHLDLLVTQNVDGLHQRAGSRAVIDLHGPGGPGDLHGLRPSLHPGGDPPAQRRVESRVSPPSGHNGTGW